MSQSLAKNTVHLVFSTKHRRPYFREEVRPRVFAYLAGIFKEWDSPAVAVGGYDDHVHALFLLSKNHALKQIVEQVKKGSSKWIKTLGDSFGDFAWQSGYGAFSVSESNLGEVRLYIERQVDHHQRLSFQEEFRELLKRHGLEFDEQHLWT